MSLKRTICVSNRKKRRTLTRCIDGDKNYEHFDHKGACNLDSLPEKIHGIPFNIFGTNKPEYVMKHRLVCMSKYDGADDLLTLHPTQIIYKDVYDIHNSNFFAKKLHLRNLNLDSMACTIKVHRGAHKFVCTISRSPSKYCPYCPFLSLFVIIVISTQTLLKDIFSTMLALDHSWSSGNPF